MHSIVYVPLIVFFVCIILENASGDKDKSGHLSEDDLNFYSFTAMDIHENIVSLDKYKGKVSLVVNVASHCGYTDSHYSGLSMLQEMFADRRLFTVLAFPCNQFGEQEPGNHHQIYQFAYDRMGANFPLFAKVNVLHKDVPPVWSYLIEQSGKAPDWNFWKYLVDHNGKVVNAWGPSITPDKLYQDVERAVEKAMKKKKNKAKKKKTKDEF